MDTKEMLDQLAGLRDERNKKTALIRQTIANLEADASEATAGIDNEITKIETQIRDAVLAGGASVKGTNLMASYVKGRTTWDTKLLAGYAVAHPEIDSLRKEGKPSVRIQANK